MVSSVADEQTETPDPADEAAALAIHDLSCPTFDDPSAVCAGVNHEDRQQATAAIAAARPHLTAEREAEVARLRAENEQLLRLTAEVSHLRARDAAWKAYATTLADTITTIGPLAWTGLDKGADVLQDIYDHATVPDLPAVLAETPATTTTCRICGEAARPGSDLCEPDFYDISDNSWRTPPAPSAPAQEKA